MVTFIYTDGACRRNGDGGWAFVAVSNGAEIHHDSGKAIETTNNRMELTAIVMAMGWAYSRGIDNVIIVTDSRYAMGVIEDTQKLNRFPGRKKNGDLIQHGRSLRRHMGSLKFEWVKGHSGNHYNEQADRLATAARDGETGLIVVRRPPERPKPAIPATAPLAGSNPP